MRELSGLNPGCNSFSLSLKIQGSKTQTELVYYQNQHKKAANPHFCEGGTNKFLKQNIYSHASLKLPITSSWWCKWKSQRITKVIRLHPLGAMNVLTKCYSNSYLSLDQSDGLTDNAIPCAMLLACPKMTQTIIKLAK